MRQNSLGIRVPRPRHGTVVAYIALVVAMSGTAGAITVVHARVTKKADVPVTMYLASAHYTTGNPCPVRVGTLATKHFVVPRGGFFEAYLLGTASSTLKVVSPPVHNPVTLRWVLDGEVLSQVTPPPTLDSQQTYDFPDTVDLDSLPIWLTSGKHSLLIQGVTRSIYDAPPNQCAGYTANYSNMHVRLSPAP